MRQWKLAFSFIFVVVILAPSRACGREDVSGPISDGTVWKLDRSPYFVMEDISVHRGATLTIEAGTRVEVEAGKTITVEGRLIAEGTPDRRSLFTARSDEPWNGIRFEDSREESRIAHADVSHAGKDGAAISIHGAHVVIDDVAFSEIKDTVIELEEPHLLLRGCEFPNVGGAEVIHGGGLREGGLLRIESCTFRATEGGDIVDFTGARRPGPVLEVLDCVFLGGHDDGLDLDGTDAEVDRCVFRGFRSGPGGSGTANGISASESSDVVVRRSIFIDNDYGFLAKEDARLRIEESTITRSHLAAVQLAEAGRDVKPGRGVVIAGSIVWDNTAAFAGVKDRSAIKIETSIVPEEFAGLGTGNLSTDPRFVEPPRDLRLRPESPARRSGIEGRDRGAPPLDRAPPLEGDPASDPPKTSPGPMAHALRINEIQYHPSEGPEWIELHNTSGEEIELGTYAFTSGIEFSFPEDARMPPWSFVTVASDAVEFQRTHPGVPCAGTFSGRLDNAGERITLSRMNHDESRAIADRVTYGDRGEWPREADGSGPSLELVNPVLEGTIAGSWAASTGAGTPGSRNSAFDDDPPPSVSRVKHRPRIPAPRETLTVTARVASFGGPQHLGVTLLHRLDNDPAGTWNESEMRDDGAHGDGERGDGIFGARLAGAPADSVIEYSIHTVDHLFNRETTAPTRGLERAYLCLVAEGSGTSDGYPTLDLILRRAALAELGKRDPESNEPVGGTLLVSSGRMFQGCEIRYRGSSSRRLPPPNKSYRVRLPPGARFHGETKLNLNAPTPLVQWLGMDALRRAGIPAPRAELCRLRLNGHLLHVDPAGVYVLLQNIDDDFPRKAFPDTDGGSVYRGTGQRLDFLGDDPAEYLRHYKLETSVTPSAGRELMELCRTFNDFDSPDYARRLAEVIDLEEWIDCLAVQAVLANSENGLYNGNTGDFFLYHHPTRGFLLLPWDLDSVVDSDVTNLEESIFPGDPDVPVNRFRMHPEVRPRYVGRVLDLTERLLDHDVLLERLEALGSAASPEYREKILRDARTRREFIARAYGEETRAAPASK